MKINIFEGYMNKEFDIIEELNDEQAQDDEFEISYNVTDRPVLVIENYLKDKILAIPEIQRPEVWDRTRKSKFIDSLLRGLPTPNLFFYDNKNEEGIFTKSKYIIVDGFQRVSAIRDFFQDDLVLSRSKDISPKWAGKKYSELDQYLRDKFRYSNIPITYFYQDTPKSNSSISLIFERINTGSVALDSQEIREAIFFSGFIKKLREFDKNKIWLKLTTKEDVDNLKYPSIVKKSIKALNNRKSLILRYFLMRYDYEKILLGEDIQTGSLDKRLENICKIYSSNTKEENQNLFSDFEETLKYVYDIFGAESLYTPKEDGGTSNRIHPTIFDSLLVATQIVMQNKEYKIKLNININEFFRNVLYNQYQEIQDNPFRKQTLNPTNIKARIDYVKENLYEKSI